MRIFHHFSVIMQKYYAAKKMKERMLSTMLNLANGLSDSKAVYLQDSNARNDSRSMDLYLSHNNVLMVLGYKNGDLVWFSKTDASDTFLSRRIFESIKQNVFYRAVKLADALASVNLAEEDLQYMFYMRLDNVEKEYPSVYGHIVGDGVVRTLTGVGFATFISTLLKKLKSLIAVYGTEDDILTDLEKDRHKLDSIYYSNDANRQARLTDICEKWRKAECFKLCDRVSVRKLYHEVSRFDETVANLMRNSA